MTILPKVPVVDESEAAQFAKWQENQRQDSDGFAAEFLAPFEIKNFEIMSHRSDKSINDPHIGYLAAAIPGTSTVILGIYTRGEGTDRATAKNDAGNIVLAERDMIDILAGPEC